MSFKIVIYKESKGIFSIRDDEHLYSSLDQAMAKVKEMGFSEKDYPTTYMKLNPSWICVFASEKKKTNYGTSKVYIFKEVSGTFAWGSVTKQQRNNAQAKANTTKKKKTKK